MFTIVPSRVFFTKGVGRDKSKLGSFEKALRSAHIAEFNLVEVSSIFPPNAQLIDIDEGLSTLKPGQILFLILAKNSSNELNRLISAAVGLAVPKDREMYGYLSEHHSFGETEKTAGDYAEELAAEMLASTLGIDSLLIWDKTKKIYRLDDRILLTKHISISAIVEKPLEWTTAVAAAVLIP